MLNILSISSVCLQIMGTLLKKNREREEGSEEGRKEERREGGRNAIHPSKAV